MAMDWVWLLLKPFFSLVIPIVVVAFLMEWVVGHVGEVESGFVKASLLFGFLEVGLDHVKHFFLVVSSSIVPIEVGSSSVEVERSFAKVGWSCQLEAFVDCCS